MADKRANFTEQGAQRIVDAVRFVELLPIFRAKALRKTPIITNEGFWATITDNDGSGQYSWTALEPESDDTLSTNVGWGQGSYSDETGYAVNVDGITDIADDTRVWLTPARGQDYYLFSGGDSEAYLYIAYLNGALATSDGTATIDGAIAIGGTNGNPTSAANDFDMEGDDDAICIVIRNGTSYLLIQVKCPA